MKPSSTCAGPTLTPFDVSGTASKFGPSKKRVVTGTVSLQPGLVGSSVTPPGNFTISAIGTYKSCVVTGFVCGFVPTIVKG
jgi:hypothetical protein